MTLLSVRNQLIGILCQKELITTDDFASIKVDAAFADRRDDLIRAALDQLCNFGLIAKVGDQTWVLSEPLNGAGQEIHLSMGLCNEIANVINTNLAAKEIEHQVDALNLGEGHIVALLQIIDEILGTEPAE